MRLFDDILASLLVMAWMVEARGPYTGGPTSKACACP